MHHNEIIEQSIADLRENPSNSRTHSDRQVQQIANSIRAFGFVNPVLIDETSAIIAGVGRVRAARKLGLKSVPTLLVDHLSDAEKRAYIIADNRLAERAGWDSEILAIELQHLLEADIAFEITDIGFDMAEIDLILADPTGGSEADPADSALPQIEELDVSRTGDLWEVGDHRLLCGTALEADSYAELMRGEVAALVFTDPPYNLRVSQISGLGKTKHREFQMASGEMSETEYTRFLTEAFRHMASASAPGSIHFVCMDWRHLWELLGAGRIAYSSLKNIIVWVKSGGGGKGALYRSRHEFVAVFKNGSATHQNNVLLGRYGRNRSNVWEYAGLNSFQKGRDEALAMHPTVKPVALVADAILDCSRRGDVILDPFVGSGTSIIAAHRTGRRCFAIELDPKYVDAALRRVRDVLSIDPVCVATGQTFSAREREARSAATTVAEGG